MPQDPRSRISVGIDGRQYVRSNVYIDVLSLPTITEAVRAASEMLRRGIIHAMSTCPDDEAASKQARLDRQKSAQQSQAATSVADRDPVSVYTDAIAKRPRKAPATDLPEGESDALDSPVLIVKETMASDKGPASTRAWNSAKKAGPSILQKRSRPPSSTAGSSSSSERVFQPALKREKRAELEKKQALLEAAAKARTPLRGKETRNVHASKTLLVAKPVSSTQKPASKQSFEIMRSSTAGSSKPLSSVALQERMHQKKAPETVAQKLMRSLAKRESSTEKSKSQSTKSASAPMLLQSQKQLKTINSLRAPGVRKLPASWSQVSSNGLKSATGKSSMQLRKLGSSFPPKASSSSTPAAKGGGLGGNKFTAQQLTMLRNRTEGLPPVRPAVQSKLGPDGIIPVPSSSGLQVKYVPGSEVINGVRPNGYTVSREGVVKPVVTFSPKPKAPHKLRQTSLEKIFEALRDVKKLSEGEALALALRTEQEMYAEAPGRMEYRDAANMKLKDIRK